MGWVGRSIDGLAKWLLRFRIIAIPARWIANSRPAWSIISRTDRVRERRMKTRVMGEELPQHVSIIMDGNRRFASDQGLAATIGHRYGKEKLEDVMDWILELGIPYLTVYALSTENVLSREPEELEGLFDLYVEGLKEMADDERIHRNDVRVQVVGRMDLLPERVLEAIEYAKEKTSKYDKFVFTVCLAYGSREEIVDAVREIAADHAGGGIELTEISESEISKRLWTGEMPDPDLVIRTSGEERISNFLLWQMAYSELYFTDVYWPSFSRHDLLEAIEAYQNRKRRYGE
ncbi:MAG: polyprenyl diphosphate synthase [Candidatus Thermoplasmatota archaeon]|nr:polyprenyl diphosphate synthase [Candidatus Thermoplasmatota archaeon]